MLIKEELIQKLANKFQIEETIVSKIITHQFDGANNATLSNKSVEISGFGKFLFNEGRALRQMEKYNSQLNMYNASLEDPTLSPAERRNLEMRLATVNSNIKHLKPKL